MRTSPFAIVAKVPVVALSLLLGTVRAASAALSDESGLTATAGQAGLGRGITDPNVIIGRIIGAGLGLLGSVFVVLLVYAGFIWMTAQGNEEKIKKAKGMITSAVVGLVVVFSSYAIATAIIQGLTTATSATP